MTTIPQPDFVGRLLGDGAELAVRPLLPSLFDPVPAPEPSEPFEPFAEPVARQSLQPEPRVAAAEPEVVVREPKAEQPVRPQPSAPPRAALPEVPKREAAQPKSPRRTVQETPLPEPKAVVPRRAPEVLATRSPEPLAPVKSTRGKPVAAKPQEIPVVQQVEKTVVRQGVNTVIPVIAPITPVLPAARPQSPVVPRRAKAVEQTVHITIGRVEVKAPSDKAPERRAAPRRQPTTSLEDYLRSRGGGTA
ncbi:hypothetical protein GCM10022247_29120 [Allokutzneria multivorans]|uniref:Uncharacterized protein n=1 Tax=Allokutzneria multivorans TaxID=1142134 RepID=A0ABP7S2C8_9PSEU